VVRPDRGRVESQGDHRTWQSFCLGARGQGDTKLRALAYVRQRCADCAWLGDYNKEVREAVVDAMCIALWAATEAKSPTSAA
jgi:hypothetical protein